MCLAIDKDYSDASSIRNTNDGRPSLDSSSRQSQKSNKALHKNINLLELKMMAANRAMKSSNDLLKYSEPTGSLSITPIMETKSEGSQLNFNII